MLFALGALLALGSGAAHAQIVKEKPAKVKAANRRALREAKRTDSPYKDSHLDVTAEQLKRGKSTQPQADISRDVNYGKGTAPNVKPAGLLGLRRDKTTTLVRKEQRQRRKLAARNDEKK
ncbi:hypothetical protein [Hymenobacter properus]|uniref:Uncharacterized protein n=1 Tax=Hymenobacter properus TaxID=2791026 RepID=A0A931BF52_9BACT|nr:hypothetical protein [Hymenobacter properus]MBF9141323.1 hypothetical protein [Hymenobacter properus]MBR7720133.1 hypothetical protein [Microvirga sp. SRT04]